MDITELIDTAARSETTGQARITEIQQAIRDATSEVDLDALDSAAAEAFDARFTDADEHYTAEVTAELEAIADVADAVRAERAAQQQQATEQADRAAELAARVNGPPGDGDGNGDDDESTDGDDTGETAAPNDNDNGNTDTAPAESTPEGTGSDGADTEGRQPVAASNSRRITAQQLNAHRPRHDSAPNTRPVRRMTLTAAADVPQVPSGSALDMNTLAHATIRRFQSMPLGSPSAVVRNGLAIIKRESDETVTASGERSDMDKIDALADESRLPGGSLLAAAQQNLTAAAQQGTFTYGGAWCAPSETDYTLCPSLADGNAGIADFPAITVQHGGLRYPVYRQYPEWDITVPDLDENTDFTQNPKECIAGPCPEWTEERLRPAYLCITGDILRERGYPELTQRFIDDALVKYKHAMNAKRLAWIDNASEALSPFDASAGMGSASHTIADRIGLLVEWMRELYRMSEGATLEGVAPMWLKGLLRSDIAKRNNRPSGAVGDAEVNQVFSDRGARVQWVYDWGGMNASGSTTPPAAFPDTANLLLYPAGSWVAADQDIITLDALYDSQNLRTNTYTALFTESAYLMLNRCNPSYKVQLTGLCANGAVGPFRDNCPPAAASEPVA